MIVSDHWGNGIASLNSTNRSSPFARTRRIETFEERNNIVGKTERRTDYADVDGFEHSGGRLKEPLIFRDRDIDIPVRMIGFLTCYTSGLLRRYDEDGLLVAERKFPGGEFQ